MSLSPGAAWALMRLGAPENVDVAYLKSLPQVRAAHLDGRTPAWRSQDEHVQPARANRHPQANLPRPLGHRHQQDVHDADPAHDERDRGDRRQQQRHDAAAALHDVGDLTEVPDRKIVHVSGLDVMVLENHIRCVAECEPRLRVARTNRIGRPRRRTSERLARAIDQNAVSFRSAPIQAQKIFCG